VDVVLRSVGGIIRCPLHHGQRTALERHQIEEATAVLERDAVLNLDQAGGTCAILEDALLHLHRSIRWPDQKAGSIRHRVAHTLDHCAQIALVVFEG